MDATLSRIYAPIREELEAAAGVRAPRAGEGSGEHGLCDVRIEDLLHHAAALSGKRLRPALLLLSARAFGMIADRHIRAAAAVELIHTATLLHDDVIDDAEVRRGGDTVKARSGNEMSIMLGDLLFARALEIFAQGATPAEQCLLTAAVREVCEGELLQLLARPQRALDEAAYLRIVSKKTGALCAAAAALGAAMAGQDDDAVDAFAAFGRAVGVALQISDDCLDIRGSEQVVGKTLGLDLLDGKLTLPLIYARDQAGEAARRQLDELLANPAGAGWRSGLADFLTRCGAFDYCDRVARQAVERGTRAIAFVPQRPARESLLALADFVIRRDH